MAIYDDIPQSSLRWLNNLSGKTGAPLEPSDQTAPAGWLPPAIASRLEPGKVYVMTLAGSAGTEIIAVTGSGLVRGLEGTAPREWPVGTDIFQAITAGQVQWLVSVAPEPAEPGPLQLSAITIDGEHDIYFDVAGAPGGLWAVSNKQLPPSNAGGVLVSTDDGKTWSAGGEVFSGKGPDVLAYGNGVFVAALQVNQLAVSNDNGQTWTHRVPGLENGVITSIETDGAGTWAAASTLGGLAMSYDNGDTWDMKTAVAKVQGFGIVTDGNGNWLTKGGDSFDILRSTDNGATWDEINIAPVMTGRLSYMNGTVMTINSMRQCYISTDFGDTWTQKAQLPIGEGESSVSAFSIVNDGKAWVVAGSKGHVWISEDDGETWDLEVVGSMHVRAASHSEGKILLVGNGITLEASR